MNIILVVTLILNLYLNNYRNIPCYTPPPQKKILKISIFYGEGELQILKIIIIKN